MVCEHSRWNNGADFLGPGNSAALSSRPFHAQDALFIYIVSFFNILTTRNLRRKTCEKNLESSTTLIYTTPVRDISLGNFSQLPFFNLIPRAIRSVYPRRLSYQRHVDLLWYSVELKFTRLKHTRLGCTKNDLSKNRARFKSLNARRSEFSVGNKHALPRRSIRRLDVKRRKDDHHSFSTLSATVQVRIGQLSRFQVNWFFFAALCKANIKSP